MDSYSLNIMDFIPLEPSDDLKSLIGSAGQFPLRLDKINNRGDYENENIVFVATEDIESLYDFILFYSIEDSKTGLPIYAAGRYLTFDEIELQKGDRIQIYTRSGEDKTTLDDTTGKFCNVVYWGLPKPIWYVPHSSFELMKRNDSYSGGLQLDPTA